MPHNDMGMVMKTNIPAMNHALLWVPTCHYMERDRQNGSKHTFKIWENEEVYWLLSTRDIKSDVGEAFPFLIQGKQQNNF